VGLVWKAWTAYLHRAGAYQSLVLLNVVYAVVFGPSVVVARLLRARLLDLDNGARSSFWMARQPTRKTLVELRRQF
jgi:hypothetical protein